MFERFMNCIVPFHMVCLLRYTASSTKSLEHLYYILLFYSSSCIHPAFILHSSCIHPVCILSTSCIHPVCILSTSRHSSGTQSFLSSSVLSYLRYYLTADSRTSPVPAIFHFFILFYYFIISMFERFMICIVSFHFVCLLWYTTSRLHPVIHPAPNPFYHLRSYLTFGTILPRILEQVLCLRYSTSFSLFITFHFSMFERFMKCIVSFSYCVSFTIQYLCTPIPPPIPAFIPHSSRPPSQHSSRRVSCVCTAPYPFFHLRYYLTFGTILPLILEQVLCPRYSTFLSFFITFISWCSRDFSLLFFSILISLKHFFIYYMWAYLAHFHRCISS
jgi:hypothetical protein